MDFLTPAIGETASRIVIIALVLLLLGALSLLLIGLAMRVFNGRSLRSRRSDERAPRLAIPDALTVDSRRKLVLIRRDNIEHLVMIGGGTDFVVEPAIQRFMPNSRTRVPAGAEASAPQPAAMPPLSGSIGPGRPLAARSRGAVQAGQHPGAEQRAGGRSPDNAPAREAPASDDKEIVRAAEKAPPKPAPAMAARPEPAPEPTQTRPASPMSPPPRPTPTAATAARPAKTDRPRPSAAAPGPAAAPTSRERAPEPASTMPESLRPTPASAAPRPAARPTAAAKPPAGHPSSEPPASDRAPPPGEAPAEPLPRPPAAGRSEPQRKPAGLGEDTDMTALLGEIFGQNKH